MADSAAGGSEHSARTTRTAGSGARDPCSSPRQPAQDAAAAAQGASLRGEQQRACRVPGCCEPLKAGYGSKYRICAVHYATPCLMLDGEAHRFCQQCGQVHLLSAFDEDRRSCRDSLRRHQDCRLARKKRARQRAQQALRDAGAAAASAAAPKAAARPKAAPAGKAGAPKAAPGGKAGAPKGAPAKAAAAGETGAAGAPRAAATAKAPKTAKRKRQAKGAEAGPVRPRKQQKPSQQQGKEGSQEQQQKPPQPQGEEGSQLPKLQTKPRAGVQQVPAAKRARSEAAPSSDGSTQDRADIFKEEPSLPLPVPQTPAAPRSPQRACQPAAEPAPPALLPQQSCSQPLPPADEAPSTSASEQAEADEAAAAEPAPAAAAAPAAPPSRPPSHPVLSEPQQSQQQAAKRDAASDAAVWADWRQLMGQLEVQVPSDQPQQAQHGAARQALPPTQPPQPLLLCQALQLMDTPVCGLPDVPSLDDLLALSSGMGFDLQPDSTGPAQQQQHACWPPLSQHPCSRPAAAGATPSGAGPLHPVAALKGSRSEPAALGAQPGPETPTSAEQAPCHITLMQRREGCPPDRPSLHVYEVTRSSQRCFWQLSCEFSSTAAVAQCR